MKLLGYKAVAELLGVSSNTLWSKLLKDESFPQRVVLGPRQHRWVEEEVIEWVNNRRSAQNDGNRREEAVCQ